MTQVVTALTPEDDSRLAAGLEATPCLSVVRRCADVAELLSVCEAGVGNCAVVSAGLRGLDLSVVARLRAAGVLVVGACFPGDESAERRLRQLSVTAVLSVDASPSAVAAVIEEAPHTAVADVGGRGAILSGAPFLDAGSDSLSQGPEATETPGWRPAGAPDLEGGDTGTEPAEPEAGRVVAVWGPIGAPGRTTVAVSLAAELASRGVGVLLVDADTYGGCVAQTLGLLDEAPGLAAAARAADQGALDVVTLARLAPEVLSHLRVLTGIPRADRWPEISAEALERVLELGRTVAEVIVVDCGFCLEDDEELSYDTRAPRRNATTLATLAAADTVLAVGAADAVSLQRFVRGLQQLGTVPCAAPVPVVNRVRASSVGARPRESLAEVLQRFAGLEGLHLLPEDRDAVDGALLAGRAVVEHAPDSAFRRAVGDLATVLVPASRSRRGGSGPRRWRFPARTRGRGAVRV